jgi:hypothetical protein
MYKIWNLNMCICVIYKKDKNTYWTHVSFIVCNLTVTCCNLVLTDSHGCQYGPAIIVARISNDLRKGVMFDSLDYDIRFLAIFVWEGIF